MSFFTFDESQAKSGFDPMPIGEYEAIISKAEVTQSQAGNDMIKVTLTVREDVDQAGQKRKVFDNIVFTEKAMFKVHQIAGAVGVENAESVHDFAEQLLYKPVRFKNKHETYNGNTNDRVNFYKQAEVEYDGHGGSTGNAFDSNTVDISDEDLPF